MKNLKKKFLDYVIGDRRTPEKIENVLGKI